MTDNPDHAGYSEAERSAIHERWLAERHRRTEDPHYREEWYSEQCGACRFWFPLAGALGNDYGACANAASPFDGRIRFEHDGCDAFQESGTWSVPEDHETYRRWRLYLDALDNRDERGLLLLRDALTEEPDRELALAVILRALEAVTADERREWIDLAPAGQDRERAEARAKDLELLTGGPAGQPGEWSEWLQLRLAATTSDPATLETLARAGRTKRVRRLATERKRAMRDPDAPPVT
ncbi:DUF3027 domain-containing protein [Nonomuraea jabiensis]|uniref:DUF3027 domain-containing protein n=1 Tax=Nonomuraea jabiensis TaxID=882448 RepID=A0A7W9LAR3_9ACTN|nr:DUF3027 domain-containing protein [Nonomuraea jabiensis]MBB5776909.1 hypothetical protein [Nonomuraea jabiensis]